MFTLSKWPFLNLFQLGIGKNERHWSFVWEKASFSIFSTEGEMSTEKGSWKLIKVEGEMDLNHEYRLNSNTFVKLVANLLSFLWPPLRFLNAMGISTDEIKFHCRICVIQYIGIQFQRGGGKVQAYFLRSIVQFRMNENKNRNLNWKDTPSSGRNSFPKFHLFFNQNESHFVAHLEWFGLQLQGWNACIFRWSQFEWISRRKKTM